MNEFTPNGLPMLIGSLPITDHKEAVDLVFKYSPFIPNWVQLPKNRLEGMISQFLPGMPGYKMEGDREFIDSTSEDFLNELTSFYEDFLRVTSGEKLIEDFNIDKNRLSGLYHLVERLKQIDNRDNIVAIKGQITGPITFATAVKDREGRAIFYDEQLRDMAIKHLLLHAMYQAKVLSQFGKKIIIFLDEPALAGFGSSEFISISKEDVFSAFSEIINALHEMDVLVGIHVCANTDWSLITDSSADILNFDAYSYFDKLILYKEKLKKFLEMGKFIAWGIVPTEGEFIEKEELNSLCNRFDSQLEQAAMAFDYTKDDLISKIFITPSCGCGSLNLNLAEKVLKFNYMMYEKYKIV